MQKTGCGMIRVALIVIAFFGITLTLILMQPSAPVLTSTDHNTGNDDNVTRSVTDYDAMSDQPDISVYEQGTALAGLTTPAVAPEAEGQVQMPTPASPTPTNPDNLESLIISALQQGQNEGYIDALVNDAADKGLVEVPGELITADGRVDTSTLLKVLSKSPDAMRAGGTLYTVQAGDSLASISYRFYGTTGRADALLDVNAAVMARSGLAVGQELVIPPK